MNALVLKMKSIFLVVKNFIFAEKDKLYVALNVITNIATIFSVVVVLLTLWEMQIQRNNAYMPDIIFEPVQVNVSWGDITKLATQSSDLTVSFNPTLVKIPSRNIGVGVAKQVTYSIDISTFIELIDLLRKLDSNIDYTYSQNGNQFILSIGDSKMMFSSKYQVDKVFLLPNAEESFDFVIPMHYVRLIQDIYTVHGIKPIDIPNIKVFVSFTDVQGVHYNKQITLAVTTLFMIEDEDSNGYATYEIIMK